MTEYYIGSANKLLGKRQNAPIPRPLPLASPGEGKSRLPDRPPSSFAGSGADRRWEQAELEAVLNFTSPPLGADAPRCPLSDAERGLAERSEAGGEVNEASRSLCFLDGCPSLKAGGERASPA